MENINYTILGCTAALVSAAAWALDPIIYKKIGTRVHPLGINLGRGVIGLFFLLIMLAFAGFEPVSKRGFWLIGISGLFGIALGDTFFLMGLMRLGPRLSVLMETLCPVVTVIFALIFLKERPLPWAWAGIILTISGVAWVLWERTPRIHLKENWTSGIKYGILSITSTATGIIFAKMGLETVPALEATAIKLFFGSIGLVLWGLVGLKIKSWVEPLVHKKTFSLLFIAVFIGIGIGLLFSVVALKYADASIAVPLNSTTPIFILPMVILAFNEKISLRSVLGAFVAVIGIILIFLNT